MQRFGKAQQSIGRRHRYGYNQGILTGTAFLYKMYQGEIYHLIDFEPRNVTSKQTPCTFWCSNTGPIMSRFSFDQGSQFHRGVERKRERELLLHWHYSVIIDIKAQRKDRGRSKKRLWLTAISEDGGGCGNQKRKMDGLHSEIAARSWLYRAGLKGGP